MKAKKIKLTEERTFHVAERSRRNVGDCAAMRRFPAGTEVNYEVAEFGGMVIHTAFLIDGGVRYEANVMQPKGSK